MWRQGEYYFTLFTWKSGQKLNSQFKDALIQSFIALSRIKESISQITDITKSKKDANLNKWRNGTDQIITSRSVIYFTLKKKRKT